MLGITSPRLVGIFWLPEARAGAPVVKQQMRVQFPVDLQELVGIEQGDRTDDQ